MSGSTFKGVINGSTFHDGINGEMHTASADGITVKSRIDGSGETAYTRPTAEFDETAFWAWGDSEIVLWGDGDEIEL